MYLGKRKQLITCCICLAMAMAVLSIVVLNASAANLEKSIDSYLKEREINYTSAYIKDDTLTVDLISTGDTRCTIDDVKAINCIYTAVHSNDVDGTIRNVQIRIFNVSGNLLYDYYQADAVMPNDSSAMVADLEEKDSKTLDMEPKDALSSIASSNSFTIEDISIKEADGILGQCADIIVKPETPEDVTLSDLRLLYENIEIYAIRGNEITQCSLSMVDEYGECLLYMAGDVNFCNIITWVSPEMEDSIIANEGPQQ